MSPTEVVARQGWVDPGLRRKRALPAAVTLVERVHAGDRQGVEILMSRFTDWGALAVILAGWADLAKAAAGAREGRAA